MRVEFLRDWKWFKKGQVCELTKGRGDLLCKRKLCKLAGKPARQPKAKPVAAVPAPAPESVPSKPVRRKHAVQKPQKAD